MSTENSIDTKMQKAAAENNSGKTTTIVEHDQAAIGFKEFYNERRMEKGISQGKEAWALDRSQQLVQQYLDPYSNRNLPVYLAVRSELGDDIIGWMAEQRKGHYTPRVGQLNGSKKDELSQILKACAEIAANDHSDTICVAQFDLIIAAAKRGKEECA